MGTKERMSKVYYQNSKPVGYVWERKKRKLSSGDIFILGGLSFFAVVTIGYIGYHLRK